MSPFREKSKFEQLRAEKYAEVTRARRIKHAIRAAIIAAVVVAGYIVVSFFFKGYFYPNTVINGVNCSWKSVGASADMLGEVCDGYTLTIHEMDGKTETISGDDIEIAITPEETLKEHMKGQKSFGWIVRVFQRRDEFDFENTIVYNEDVLTEEVDGLNCLNEKYITYPEGPKFAGYEKDVGFGVTDPEYGNVVDRDRLLALAKAAAGTMNTEIDLLEDDCYEFPDYDDEIARLDEICDRLNKVVNTTITYEFGDEDVVLDGTRLSEWLVFTPVSDGESEEESTEDSGEETSAITLDEIVDGSVDIADVDVSVNSDDLAQFVYDMADTYNTKKSYHSLINHAGEEITIRPGNYGWLLDQATTLEHLKEYLAEGEDYTGEADFTQRAASFGANDYGDTYIEVSISAQHFWYYRDGVLTLESDLVSGNTSNGHGTPLGIYQIAYKARNQTLEGENYSTPVDYWMPFYAGVGLHDASWRGSFGGTIYKYGGSHGCLNLPHSVAEELYGYIEGGEAVLIY